MTSAPRPSIPPAPRPTQRGLRAWLDALAVYRNPRLLAVFGQGFSSGLPLPLTTTTLTYWLARDGVDKTSIGLFALFGMPYAFKFLWAPLLDQWTLPGAASLGRRRGWILALQAGLVAAITSLGLVDPTTAPIATGLVVFAIAFFSASQDIVVDAYRIEILEDHEQGAGAAATQAGYRAGMLASGAGAIALADFASWPETFAVLAFALALSMFCVVFARSPRGSVRRRRARSPRPHRSARPCAAPSSIRSATSRRARAGPSCWPSRCSTSSATRWRSRCRIPSSSSWASAASRSRA
ncbi:MAG: MFS transporter [Deltaproteobacteria bacterium]|nr:MFS transporter [Deltaproteobacteria bacterium]